MNHQLPFSALRSIVFASAFAGILYVIGIWLASNNTTSDQAEQGSTVYDAGAIFAKDQPVIEHTFHVRNTSDHTIRLTDQLCACTCTTTKLKPNILGSGEAGELTMSMRMTDAYAPRTAMNCQLLFDDGSSKQFSLAYRLYPRMMASKEFLDFGTFSEEEKSSDPNIDLDVVLFAPSGSRLAALQSIEAPEEFTVEEVSSSQSITEDGVQQRRHRIRVSARPQTLLAGGSGTLTKIVRFISDDGSVATASLIWRQNERFRCSPSPVSFGVVDPGRSPVIRKAVISTSLAAIVRPLAVNSDSPYLKATRDEVTQAQASETSNRIELTLAVPDDYQGDVISGKVEVRMADDRHSTVLIPWSAIVRRPQSKAGVHGDS